MRSVGLLGLAAIGHLASATSMLAVEGGIETYLLGSRDNFAGVLPPPGNYLNNNFVFFLGSAPLLSAGGVIVEDPEVSVFTYKFNFTRVFDAQIGSARVGFNFNVPYVSATGKYNGELTSGYSGALEDSRENAFGDLVSRRFSTGRKAS